MGTVIKIPSLSGRDSNKRGRARTLTIVQAARRCGFLAKKKRKWKTGHLSPSDGRFRRSSPWDVALHRIGWKPACIYSRAAISRRFIAETINRGPSPAGRPPLVHALTRSIPATCTRHVNERIHARARAPGDFRNLAFGARCSRLTGLFHRTRRERSFIDGDCVIARDYRTPRRSGKEASDVAFAKHTQSPSTSAESN